MDDFLYNLGIKNDFLFMSRNAVAVKKKKRIGAFECIKIIKF